MRIEEVTGLAARLSARQVEIERAVLTRVEGLSDAAKSTDAEYMEGLIEAVRSAIGFSIDTLERDEERPPPIPTALLSQARLAARNRVTLDTVLRRYIAGFVLLGDFTIEEAERMQATERPDLRRLLRSLAALLDRIVVTVSEEYSREQQRRPRSPEEHRLLKIRKLLAGELVDTTDLTYNFQGSHLGLVGSGPGTAQVLKELVRPLDLHLLLVHTAEETIWAWLGSRSGIDQTDIDQLAEQEVQPGIALAVGEPGEGLPGWRLTHRLARAALLIAKRGTNRPVRYAEVALVTSMLHDDLLVTSLKEIYLSPLRAERDGGVLARRTLRAYFAAGRNISSAAARLGVSRQAVGSRLRKIEQLLGRPLVTCAAEIEAALRLSAQDR